MKPRFDQFAHPSTIRVIPSEPNNWHDGVVVCTVDGVPLRLGMDVWDRNGQKSTVTLMDGHEEESSVSVVVHLSGSRGRWWNCFSSPQAAAAANEISKKLIQECARA